MNISSKLCVIMSPQGKGIQVLYLRNGLARYFWQQFTYNIIFSFLIFIPDYVLVVRGQFFIIKETCLNKSQSI